MKGLAFMAIVLQKHIIKYKQRQWPLLSKKDSD